MNTCRTLAVLLLAVGGVAAPPAQAQQSGFSSIQLQYQAPSTVHGPAGEPDDFTHRNMAANAQAFDVRGSDRRLRPDAVRDAIAGAPRPELRFADQQKIGPTMFDDPAIW